MTARGLSFFAVFICFAVPCMAQEAAVEPLEIGASGTAYERSIRLKRVDSEVAYYDPTRPAPELGTSEEPPERPRSALENTSDDVRTERLTRTVVILLSIAGLATALYLFVTLGGAGSISFGDAPENAARRARKGDPKNSRYATEQAADLNAILKTSDRREALVALSGFLLTRLVAAQGVLLQRSWTAREALLRIPSDIPGWQALRNLVLASERVHFGERDVTEEEFEGHLAEIKPILARITG